MDYGFSPLTVPKNVNYFDPSKSADHKKKSQNGP